MSNKKIRIVEFPGVHLRTFRAVLEVTDTGSDLWIELESRDATGAIKWDRVALVWNRNSSSPATSIENYNLLREAMFGFFNYGIQHMVPENGPVLIITKELGE